MRIAICGNCRFMTGDGMTLMCRVDNKPVPKNGVCDFNGLGDFLKYRPEYYLAGNKKGPAALGDAGGRGSRKYQEHGQNATGMTTAQAKKCLHGHDDDGNLDLPNLRRQSYIASNAHNNIGQSSILGRFNVRDTVRTRLLRRQGSVTPSLSLFKSLTTEADMPNSHSSPSQTPILPPFRVSEKQAQIISADGEGTIADTIAALDALGTMFIYGGEYFLEKFDDGHAIGIGCIMRLLAERLNDKAYGSITPLRSDTIQELLDEAKGGADA